MRRIEIRLLGGFQVRARDREVTTFESQRARALLAYLGLHQDLSVPREHLAELLWTDWPRESARRNLRQALYSLRTTLSDGDKGQQIFVSGASGVQLSPDLDLWVDVLAFREAFKKGLAGHGRDTRHLVRAASLFRGDLLSGFFLRDCPTFDEWLMPEQEAVRDEVREVLQLLISSYLSRGEARFGIQYAKRLIALDALSEEAHRQLMRLYMMAGRRNGAVAHYDYLRGLLDEELGVEPEERTKDLYRSVLHEAPQAGEAAFEQERLGPLIPLVARSNVFDELRVAWGDVLKGRGRLSIVEGEPGVGKTRVVRSFVDVITSRRPALVLRGRSYSPDPLCAYGLFSRILEGAFSDVLPTEPGIGEQLGSSTLQGLLSLAPDIEFLVPEGADFEVAPPVGPRKADPVLSIETLLDVLEVMGRGEGRSSRPAVLLIDALHAADPCSLELVGRLADSIADRKIWILATADAGRDYGLDAPDANLDRIVLERLSRENVDELAGSLVDHESATLLADFLWTRSEGLPLMVAEVITYLWDRDLLVQQSPEEWHLEGDPSTELPEEVSLRDVVERRLELLPHSTRYLLSRAAVIGHQFDLETLRLAANEHIAVAEICVELALQRWLVRHQPRHWSHAGMQQDLFLWTKGARRGYFEFGHATVREAVLESIDSELIPSIHADVLAAIVEQHSDDLEPWTETLSYHSFEAGRYEDSLPYLQRAIERAAAAGCPAVAEEYVAMAGEAIDRLRAGAGAEREAALDRQLRRLEKVVAACRG